MRRSAASLRPRGLRKARLRSPSFSPCFLHTHKVTTVLLSFSYGEWNFGRLFVSLGVGDGAGRGGVVFLSSIILRGHFRLNGRCWRLLMRGWSVHGALAGRVDRCARPDSRFQSRRGGRQSLKGRGTPARGNAHGRDSPLYVTRIAAAPRGSVRTRAPGYSAPSCGRLQEWSTFSKRTLTRWQRS